MIKKTVLIFFCLVLLFPAWLSAQEEANTFAVFPFKVHGPEKYKYLEKGLQSMLQSRLTWKGHLKPVDESQLSGYPSSIASEKQAREILKDLGLAHLAWGDLTVMENQASLDVKILQEGSDLISKSRQGPLDQLIPTLEEVAEEINDQVLERKKEVSGRETETDQRKRYEINPTILYSEEGEVESSTNPQFRYSGSPSTPGRWKSQALPVEGVGIAVGDADGNGESEVFLVSDHLVQAYSIRDNKLRILAEYKVSRNLQCLNINLIDLNKDGFLEIVVSAMRKNNVNSFILNYKGENGFEVREENISYFLNVVRMPPTYMKFLVGQQMSKTRFYKDGVHTLVKMSGQYKTGKRLNLPAKANIFNFAYLPDENDYKIVVVDSSNKLKVYSSSKELQYTSEKLYASSSVGVESKEGFPGLSNEETTKPRYMLEEFHYFPSRLIPCNIHPDEKGFELIVGHNMSKASQFFKRYRQFPQGEIHSLFWGGMGLNLFWKTRVIQGSIMDYGIADINNDQEKELYACVNTYPGALGLSKKMTYVLSYDLGVKDSRNIFIKAD